MAEWTHEKNYGKFSIEWYSRDIDKKLEAFAVERISSLIPKLAKYVDFIKREAEIGTIIAIEIYAVDNPDFSDVSFDLWYDHKVKAFGMRICRNLDQPIADVRFPEEVYL